VEPIGAAEAFRAFRAVGMGRKRTELAKSAVRHSLSDGSVFVREHFEAYLAQGPYAFREVNELILHNVERGERNTGWLHLLTATVIYVPDFSLRNPGPDLLWWGTPGAIRMWRPLSVKTN
jgi:hypothetical protein